MDVSFYLSVCLSIYLPTYQPVRRAINKRIRRHLLECKIEVCLWREDCSRFLGQYREEAVKWRSRETWKLKDHLNNLSKLRIDQNNNEK